MTRETRIGLLVGLVFIFAFGLILGELTNDAEAPPIQAASLRDVDYLAGEMAGSPPVREARTPAIATRSERSERSRRRSTSDDARPDPRRQRRHVDPRTTTRRYRTARGDSLTQIARKAYGAENGHLYRIIYRANRDKLPSEDVVPVGIVLVIPPMPQ